MSTTDTGSKLDKIMRLIENHLARAAHPNTPPAEADLARTQAEKLMTKYRIEEWQAVQAGEAPAIAPLWRTLNIVRTDNEWSRSYYTLANYVTVHAGVRSRIRYGRDADGFMVYQLEMLGFESDVRYVEMLLAGIMLAFGKRLEPQFDPMESPAANAYRMRAGGMERKRIGVALYGPSTTDNEMKAKNRKVTGLIRVGAAEAGANADDLLGRTNNIKTFRESYANAFVGEMWSRLWRLRQVVGQDTTAIILSSRKESIDEAWFERYPGERPVPVSGALEGAAAEPCKRCKAAKSGACREHRIRSYSAREQAHSDAGVRHGRAAAREVDLGAGATRRVG